MRTSNLRNGEQMKKLRKILRVISSKKRVKLTKVGLVKILKKSDCPFTVAFSDHPRNLVQSDAFLACDGPNRVAVSANRFSNLGQYRKSQMGHPVMTWNGSITDLIIGIIGNFIHHNYDSFKRHRQGACLLLINKLIFF